jgi:hypothetical protein
MNIKRFNKIMAEKAAFDLSGSDPTDYGFAKTYKTSVLVNGQGAVLYVGNDVHRLVRKNDQYIFNIWVGMKAGSDQYNYNIQDNTDGHFSEIFVAETAAKNLAQSIIDNLRSKKKAPE